MGKKSYSAKDCYVRALELDPSDAHTWFNTYIDCPDGLRLDGQHYTQQACLLKALECDPRSAAAWVLLGLEGGGQVGGIDYAGADCLEKALEPEANMEFEAFEGRQPWMTKLILRVATAESKHKVEFIPTKTYRRGAKVVASFPGKYGLAWDLLQGAGQETRARDLLRKFNMEDVLKAGELSTCCVFLPEGSANYGKHNIHKDRRCWCTRSFAEGGLDYIADGKAKRCGPADVVADGKTFRTTFGCVWFDKWIEQVERAVQANSVLVVVVPDEGEPGNSQQGEMNFLDLRGFPYERMKLSDFILEARSFI